VIDLRTLVTDQTQSSFLQVAALCLRDIPDGPQVLLVQTLRLRAWVIPKGWPVDGLSLQQSAAQEAWEEAGVRGGVQPDPIGQFHYTKVKKSGLPVHVRAQVYRLNVTEQADIYPEAHRRARIWVPPAVAATMVRDPELGALLRSI
jgi:8-oxo-dGTP pyrophosphatase MutT (NUDIX family)